MALRGEHGYSAAAAPFVRCNGAGLKSISGPFPSSPLARARSARSARSPISGLPRAVAYRPPERRRSGFPRALYAIGGLACLCALAGCSGGASTRATSSPVPAVAVRSVTAAPGGAHATPAAMLMLTPTRIGSRALHAADIAQGRVLVQAQCAWCHALADAGLTSAQSAIGPPLDNAGVGHSRAWLSAALIDACAHHSPRSPYTCAQKHDTVAILTTEQRNQIVSYLLTLKATPLPAR